MGGALVGSEGRWDPFTGLGGPAVTIYEVPGKSPLWKKQSVGSALPDTSAQVFSASLNVGLVVQYKTDFLFEDEPGLQFTRVYRNQDDRSRAFGIGGAESEKPAVRKANVSMSRGQSPTWAVASGAAERFSSSSMRTSTLTRA